MNEESYERPRMVDENGVEIVGLAQPPSDLSSSREGNNATSPLLIVSAEEYSQDEIEFAADENSEVDVRNTFPGPAIPYIVLGLASLIVGVVSFISIDFMVAQFKETLWRGWFAAFTVGLPVGLCLFAVFMEVAAIFSVRKFFRVRTILENKASEVVLTRRAALWWLKQVARNGYYFEGSRKKISRAKSSAEIVDEISARVLPELDRLAEIAIASASAQSALISVMCPKQAMENRLFFLRGFRLVKQVARIYGMKTRFLGTYGVIKRILFDITAISFFEFAGGFGAQVFVDNPLFQKLFGEVAGSAVSFQRMKRVGIVSAEACRILKRSKGQGDTV